MSVFGDYSRYYNLLYKDKDYAKETEFICQLLQQYAPNCLSILELGCGTGKHAQLLAERGYTVHGVDRSYDMLEQAEKALKDLPEDTASRLSFSQGDIRTLRLDRQFDVIVSLFHVISYQTTNQDLQQTFTTAKTHLKPKGLFLFDAWYGPAVLSDPPTVRVKRLEDDMIHVTRLAEPELHPNDNLVHVNYHIFIKDKIHEAYQELHETHTMRYLFVPETEQFFHHSNMQFIRAREWMTDREPGRDTWGVYFLGRA